MSNIKIIDGLIGFAIGDALGVPVEFQERESLKKNPVIDMIGYGTHNQPPGTWCDDSSLDFCLVESVGGLAGIVYGIENIPIKWREQIARKVDIEDLGERFKVKIFNEL